MEAQHPLRAAAPYLREFRGRVFVIKLGGEVLENAAARKSVCEQLALLWHLGIKLVLVHGGGTAIDTLCTRLSVPTQKVAGRRVTSPEVLKAVKMALAGEVHVDLTAQLRAAGLPVVGVSGVDAGLLTAVKRPPVTVQDDDGGSREVDYGSVGDLKSVDPKLLEHLLAGGFLPLVAPLSASAGGEIYNTNADTVAAAVAGAVHAEKLIFLLAVQGLMQDPKQPSTLIPFVTLDQIDQLTSRGVVTGGMRPKLQAARAALQDGVPSVHLVSAFTHDALLAEIFTNEGSGTMLRRGDRA